MDFSVTLKRELEEELFLKISDYRIGKEFPELQFTQFSKRDNVFKDYKFRVFEVLLKKEAEKTILLFPLDKMKNGHRWNYWASLSEIEKQVTKDGEPISETVLVLFEFMGIL